MRSGPRLEFFCCGGGPRKIIQDHRVVVLFETDPRARESPRSESRGSGNKFPKLEKSVIFPGKPGKISEGIRIDRARISRKLNNEKGGEKGKELRESFPGGLRPESSPENGTVHCRHLRRKMLNLR